MINEAAAGASAAQTDVTAASSSAGTAATAAAAATAQNEVHMHHPPQNQVQVHLPPQQHLQPQTTLAGIATNRNNILLQSVMQSRLQQTMIQHQLLSSSVYPAQPTNYFQQLMALQATGNLNFMQPMAIPMFQNQPYLQQLAMRGLATNNTVWHQLQQQQQQVHQHKTLAHPSDPSFLSVRQTYQRKHLVIVSTTTEDSNRRNLGNVPKGHVIFICAACMEFKAIPSTLKGVKGAFGKVLSHWKECGSVNAEVKQFVLGLDRKPRRFEAGEREEYWVYTARAVGIVETKRGLFMCGECETDGVLKNGYTAVENGNGREAVDEVATGEVSNQGDGQEGDKAVENMLDDDDVEEEEEDTTFTAVEPEGTAKDVSGATNGAADDNITPARDSSEPFGKHVTPEDDDDLPMLQLHRMRSSNKNEGKNSVNKSRGEKKKRKGPQVKARGEDKEGKRKKDERPRDKAQDQGRMKEAKRRRVKAKATRSGAGDNESDHEFQNGEKKNDSIPTNSRGDQDRSSESNSSLGRSRERGCDDANLSSLTPSLSCQSTANTALTSGNTRKKNAKKKRPRQKGCYLMTLDEIKVYLSRDVGGYKYVAWDRLKIVLSKKSGWEWIWEDQWFHDDATIMNGKARLTDVEVQRWARDNLGWAGKASYDLERGRERKARQRVRSRAVGSMATGAAESKHGDNDCPDAHATFALAVEDSWDAEAERKNTAAVITQVGADEQSECESGGGKNECMPWSSSKEQDMGSDSNPGESRKEDEPDSSSSQSTADDVLASGRENKKSSHQSPEDSSGNQSANAKLPHDNVQPKSLQVEVIHNDGSSEENEYKAPPDGEETIRDKLECCQMVLHPAFKKNELSKSASKSVVSSKEEDIKDFMAKSIETGMLVDGMTSPSPGFMYICGGPGTGKTTAVTSCADDMRIWAKDSGYERPRYCLINMASSETISSKGGIMRATLRELAPASGVGKDASPSAFKKQFTKRVVILILDEIDMLFKEHGGAGETWFRTLVEWAEDRELRFSMIGISNCVNDVNSARVRDIGHSPRELVFSAYKEEDILAILKARVGKNVIDHKALELISRRVAASSGDTRKALEITSNAVGKCIDQLSEETLESEVANDDECMPLVKLPHMMRAIREGMPMRHADVISGVPQAAKVILCIAVSLGKVWGPGAEISLSVLKKYCVEATHHAVMDELGIGHIMSLVELLIDSGLLITGNNGYFNPHDVDAKLKIGVQLDDVEIALEQSLLKEGFYKSLVDYVRRECPSPP